MLFETEKRFKCHRMNCVSSKSRLGVSSLLYRPVEIYIIPLSSRPFQNCNLDKSHQYWIHFYKNCVGHISDSETRRVMLLCVRVSSHSWIFWVVSFLLMLDYVIDCYLSSCDHAITFIWILSGWEDGRGTRQRWSPRAHRFFVGEVKKGKKTHASTHKHTLTHFCLKGRCDRWKQNN